MVAKQTAVESAADELYALPPGEFTRARDECAKALRKEGDRDAAGAVKALRKPTVAAWALNQLARRRRKDVERLLKAGERLRAAQEELLAGGERSALQKAAATERELVAQLAGDATDLAGEAGERGGGLEAKIADTLHAAALDEETAEQLHAGRLEREREAIGGFGGLAAGTAAPQRKRPSPRKRTARKKSQGDGAGDAAKRRRLAAARTDERHARKELDAASKAVAHAETRAEAAETHAAEAAERARVTAERREQARRAAAAARKAHAKAESALQRAEAGG